MSFLNHCERHFSVHSVSKYDEPKSKKFKPGELDK